LSALDPGKISIWHGKLSATEDACRRYWPLLDAAEQIRAGQYTNALPRHRYVEARGLLRWVLARYLNQLPATINIQTAEHGKPYLADCPEWTFNLSHTGDTLVIAVAQACRVGIDIELCKPRDSLPRLVTKCFSDSEAAYWHTLDDGDKTAAFYRIWTAKEAFVKATGRGIALGLNQCVTDPCHPDQFARLPPAYRPTEQWRIVDLAFAAKPGLRGALVSDQPIDAVEWHDFSLASVSPVSPPGRL